MPFDPTCAAISTAPLPTATTAPQIYIDTEYRADGAEPVLLCAILGSDRVTFDLRSGDYAPLRAWVEHWKAQQAVWFAYAALAELHTLLVCGCDVAGMRVIDLYAEARQITQSHATYRLKPGDTNLLATLDKFEIPTRRDRVRKEQMRHLILSTPDYSDAELTEIVDYCFSDIEPLAELWRAIQAVYDQANCAFGEAVAIFRGDYLVASARLEHRSRGFPIDTALLERIYGNRKLVVRTLAERAIAVYGPVYLITSRGVRFSFAGLRENIFGQPSPPEWELTPSAARRWTRNS